jgi:hypothetical protein
MQPQLCRLSLYQLFCVLLLTQQAWCACSFPAQTFDVWPQPLFQVRWE